MTFFTSEHCRACSQYIEAPLLPLPTKGLCFSSWGKSRAPCCPWHMPLFPGSQLSLRLQQMSDKRNLGCGVLAGGERLGFLGGKEERPTEDTSPQDEKYWTRRKKNNVAAKRSRDARRLKENQITIRAAFLEKENMALRTEVAELRKEVGKCKTIVSKYETKYGPL